MITYKNPVKDVSRELVWNHAVESLTTGREQSRILDKCYLKKLWNYCFNDCIIKNGLSDSCKDRYFYDWLSFSDIVYTSKKAEELKVALFCGPEPENDVNHLLSLGVRIENIYAFEYDRNTFRQAVTSLKESYPTLKIYNGRIENFFTSNFIVFDIIYLDFTGSLISVFKTICSVFDNNALTGLGILAINSCFPDKTDENIDFLATYFHYQACFEYPVYFGKEEGKDYSGMFIESSGCYGYDYPQTRELVGQNFEEAYSAFQTSFVINYSNHIKPFMTVLNNSVTRQRLFDTDRNILRNKIGEFYNREEIFWEPDHYALYHFIENIKIPKWKAFFNDEKGPGGFSRKDSVDLMHIFLDSAYEKYEDVLSVTLRNALPKIGQNIPDRKHPGLFCDIPMIHLWLEQAINQMGYPFHINTLNHKRYSYTARTRRMCLDIFTFDQCRAFYDWLPMVDYYGNDLSITERQIIARMCMDAIGKHVIHILEKQYFGSALVGINEFSWSYNHYFSDRVKISRTPPDHATEFPI